MPAPVEGAPSQRVLLRVEGIVQGVGFRPFVYGLARRHGLSGYIRNDGEGVAIAFEGEGWEAAVATLKASPPPLARIDRITLAHAPAEGAAEFTIEASSSAQGRLSTAIGADAALCDACLAELFDPGNRRWRHPFITCTDCGPRYSITRSLPYDRATTSMAGFPLCAVCAAEYADPGNRRFHAEPLCCPACGPQLSQPLEAIAACISAGGIVALKGLGGFHLACDARNGAAVARLRAAKQRDGKPFAVMVAGLAAARRLVDLDAGAEAMLASRARPILLAPARPGTGIAPEVAPHLTTLGLMLPATPLQYLVFHELLGRPVGTAWLDRDDGPALVMTSANLSGRPLIADDREAATALAGIADLIAGHDRAIVMRADDSVARVIAGAPRLWRRGRGHVPEAIRLARPLPDGLALGGQLKAAACVIRGDEAFLSQHAGDLDDPDSIAFLEESARHLLASLEVKPRWLAHDRHPDFGSTRIAETLAAAEGLPVFAIQHHHAHVAAVLAEHGIDGPCHGLALDGFGLGETGEAWGGEFLLVDGTSCTRIGHLASLPQPGGDRAAREPWRMAAAALHRMGRGSEVPRRFARFPNGKNLHQLLSRPQLSPATTALGRWFDAACGILEVCPMAGFEGEAPSRLEALVQTPRTIPGAWTLQEEGAAEAPVRVLDLLPLLAAIDGRPAQEGAEAFHGTLVAALLDWTKAVLASAGARQIALSGGCLMNRTLTEGLVDGFAAAGITALLPRQAPVNDGGLALGQAFIAAQMLDAVASASPATEA